MKKKPILGLIISVPLCAASFAGWVLYSVPRDAHAYIDASPRMVQILSKLSFVQFRDLPGFSGSLGRGDAKEAALEAMEIENAAWERMAGVSFRLTSGTLLGKCLASTHERKIGFLKRSAQFAKAMTVPNDEVEQLFSDEESISNDTVNCLALALKAEKRLSLSSLMDNSSS